jgi:Fic family protein
METSDFTLPSGYLLPTLAGQRSFVPSPLPPKLNLETIQQRLSKADRKLGELRGIGTHLANPYLLIRPLQRKEAIASSNIEGTYTSLPELLLFESGVESQPRSTDTREVFNYIRSLQTGFELLKEIPVSNRLILELHKKLLLGLPKSRSGHGTPGDYRSEQNFIGKSKDISKARFIPPIPPKHLDCMSDLERFVNNDDMYGLPPLVFIALFHYQFEAIHPFPDGNGRVGRLLIPIILKQKDIMPEPLLYMSQYFEDNKDEYVDLMLRISQKSEWNPWVDFFLEGVIQSCDNTIETIRRVQDLRDEYQRRCQQARSSALLIKIVDMLFERIAITIPSIRDSTGISYTAAKNNIERLIEYGIISDMGGLQRPKFFFATELIKIFEE